jgi:hypothetical protein
VLDAQTNEGGPGLAAITATTRPRKRDCTEREREAEARYNEIEDGEEMVGSGNNRFSLMCARLRQFMLGGADGWLLLVPEATATDPGPAAEAADLRPHPDLAQSAVPPPYRGCANTRPPPASATMAPLEQTRPNHSWPHHHRLRACCADSQGHVTAHHQPDRRTTASPPPPLAQT